MSEQSKMQSIILLVLFSMTVTLMGGCAKKEEATDPFFEKWRIMAEQSKGHSPPKKEKDIDTIQTAVTKADQVREQEAQKGRKLPTQKVSLKMHESNIVAVLQALARAANQSILIKSGVEGSVNINVQKKQWDQVFTGILKTHGLTYVWEGDIIRVLTVEDLETDFKIQDIRKKNEAVEPLVNHIVNVHYADAENLQSNLVNFLSRGADGEPRGSVVVDTHTNSLIIQAIQRDVLNMVRMVNKLDRPRSQINFKAHIVETTSETARDLGVQWGGVFRANSFDDNNFWTTSGGSGGSTSADPQSGNFNPTFGDGVSGQGFGVNFPNDGVTTGGVGTAGASLGLLFGTIGSNILELQLSALQSQDKLRILSSPSITTLDNQTAYTENGERVPYVATDDEGELEVKFEDAVLRLEITPHIIDEEYLKMEILVKKDEVDTTRTVLGNPFIIKKQTKTTLITRTGETVVISGLSRQRKSDGESGVPGLKDVPGLGRLFKGTSKSDDLEDVLIFITPRILPQWQGEVQKSELEIEEQVKEQNAPMSQTE